MHADRLGTGAVQASGDHRDRRKPGATSAAAATGDGRRQATNPEARRTGDGRPRGGHPAQAEVLTAVDAHGIRTHRFFMPSRTAQELLAAREAIAAWARMSYGFMGRTPDYKAAFMASLGANPDFYAPFGGNALAWYKRYATRGLFLNHVLVNPPVDRDRAWKCVEAMRTIADQKGVSVARVALAWLLHKPHVTSVIIGAKHVDQLDDNIAATALSLSADEIATLDAVSALPEEYPGWMVARHSGTRRPAAVGPDRD